jgi:hypothetical protein
MGKNAHLNNETLGKYPLEKCKRGEVAIKTDLMCRNQCRYELGTAGS